MKHDHYADGKRARSRSRLLTAMVVLTAIGAALRFSGLGDRDFWFDESCTFIYVHQLFDWPEDSNFLVESTNLPYYVALRGWVHLFGDCEADYRSMSALVAALTIPLLGFIAFRLGGPVTGLVCIVIVAFHPLHIHYAHEARAYALWMLLLSVVLALLVEATRRGTWRWWAAYGVALWICLHLHYYTLFWAAASVVCVWPAENRRRTFRQWLTTTALVGIGFVPYFLAAVWPAGQGGGNAWIAQHGNRLDAIFRSLWAFMPAGGYPGHLRGLSLLSPDTVAIVPAWLAACSRMVPAGIVVMAMIVLGAKDRHVWTRRGDSSSNRALHGFLGGMTLLPLVFSWLISVTVRPTYLVGRYDLVAWPACVVWISIILSSFSREVSSKRTVWMTAGLSVLLAACAAIPIARMAALQPPATFHHVRAQRLSRVAAQGDLVIAFSYDRDHLLYYLYREGFSGTMVSYPSWLGRQIGWVDTASDLAVEKSARLASDANDRMARIRAALANNRRVFVLLDSLVLGGTRPRATINQVLLDAVNRAGYELRWVDQNLMILELVARGETSSRQ